MKNYLIKMILVILIISSVVNILKEKKTEKLMIENIIINDNIYKSDLSYNHYQEEVVYQGLTLSQLGAKIEKSFNSDLSGYGETLASLALDQNVDPIVAASIILLETGCTWSCSSLVKNYHNVGGMRGNGGYLKYDTLEEGLQAFINNLANNYYAKGLNTPELINTKYATNPNWYQKVYYYVNIINAN